MALRNDCVRLHFCLLVAVVFSTGLGGFAQDKEVKGFSVIEKIVTLGAEPVYEADGYHICIVAGTDKTFHKKLNTLEDIGPGAWLRFNGNRDSTGIIVAGKGDFHSWQRRNEGACSGAIADDSATTTTASSTLMETL